MDSKPPAAWLGRKNSMFTVPEFHKLFYISSKGQGKGRGSPKEVTLAIGQGIV